MNTVLLIGKINHFNTQANNDVSFTIDVQRPCEESDGTLLSDRFEICTWPGLGNQIEGNYHANDSVAIRGRLIRNREKRMCIYAEKITLIK